MSQVQSLSTISETFPLIFSGVLNKKHTFSLLYIRCNPQLDSSRCTANKWMKTAALDSASGNVNVIKQSLKCDRTNQIARNVYSHLYTHYIQCRWLVTVTTTDRGKYQSYTGNFSPLANGSCEEQPNFCKNVFAFSLFSHNFIAAFHA